MISERKKIETVCERETTGNQRTQTFVLAYGTTDIDGENNSGAERKNCKWNCGLHSVHFASLIFRLYRHRTVKNWGEILLVSVYF